jgi:hypothetical protein
VTLVRWAVSAVATTRTATTRHRSALPAIERARTRPSERSRTRRQSPFTRSRAPS